MSDLLVKDNDALKFFMTEDLYIFSEKEIANPSEKTEKLQAPEALIIPEIKQLPDITAITEEIKAPAGEIKKELSFTYLGENNKYFLILIDDSKNSEISELHKETLLKIMSAKGLEIRDLAIMNLNKHQGINFSQLKDYFSCSRIALFGIDPKRIELPSMSSNKVENHLNVKVLATFGIDEMINDVVKKKEFWAVMKEF